MLKHLESIDNVGLEMTLHHGSRQSRHQPSAVESCEQLQNISESRSVDHHVVLIMNDALQYRTAYNARHAAWAVGPDAAHAYPWFIASV